MIGPSTPPTERQLLVLRALVELRCQHGIPPTMREIADHVGMSTKRAEDHLEGLKARLLVTWSPTIARTMRLTETGWDALEQVMPIHLSA